MTVRVLVADDQDLVRTGLSMILDAQPDIEVVGQAADGKAAVELAHRLRPDVCLVDIRMPGLDGIEVTELLAGRGVPDPMAVVVITTFDLDELPRQVDAAVYRLAQEALTNALRHARNASRVEIRGVESAGTLRLRVTDDGQVDPARPATHGFGLQGMTERAQLLGGTLRAGPTPEGGWAVDAELPMEMPR